MDVLQKRVKLVEIIHLSSILKKPRVKWIGHMRIILALESWYLIVICLRRLPSSGKIKRGYLLNDFGSMSRFCKQASRSFSKIKFKLKLEKIQFVLFLKFTPVEKFLTFCKKISPNFVKISGFHAKNFQKKILKNKFWTFRWTENSHEPCSKPLKCQWGHWKLNTHWSWASIEKISASGIQLF